MGGHSLRELCARLAPKAVAGLRKNLSGVFKLFGVLGHQRGICGQAGQGVNFSRYGDAPLAALQQGGQPARISLSG